MDSFMREVKRLKTCGKKNTRNKSLTNVHFFGFQYLFLLGSRDIIYVLMQFCKITELVVKNMNVELQVKGIIYTI